MEEVLELASKVSDQAEVYSVEKISDSISFENSKLQDIESGFQAGVCLRIIKDDRLGFAYTCNLLNKEELIRNALDSLKGGVTASFRFPSTKCEKSLNTYDSAIENVSNSDIVYECKRVCEILNQYVKEQINIHAYKGLSTIRLMNTSGTDVSCRYSVYVFNAQLLYPYTSASVNRSIVSKGFLKASDEYVDYLVFMFKNSIKEVRPKTDRLKVLFLPETLYVLIWRLQTATNAMSLYQGISPVADKIGERIFDERLTIYNNPFDDSIPGARLFDDEGVLCRYMPVIEKGVLKNFYYDLYFAEKMNKESTGNGFKGSMFAKPAPTLSHLFIEKGEKSLQELIQMIDYGIIVGEALGAHSGNIPNGDFSIGVSPAIYVENGEIVGHIKDVMVAGNIYDVMKSIVGIENRIYPAPSGFFPSMLFDNINVTFKK